jgi:AcrR family transcriptional regulator
MRKSHKEELFSAAFRLFILHGYDGVSFSDIEKATGMSRGAIFHYVDTKQDLFRQVVEMFVIDKQSIDMKIRYGKDTSLRDFIDAYIKGIKQTMKEVKHLIGDDVSTAVCSRAYLNIIQQVASILPDLFMSYQQCMDREQQVWQQVITQAIERREVQSGIDVELLAQTFSTLFYGRAYRDSLTKVLDADLLKSQMLQLYKLIAAK